MNADMSLSDYQLRRRKYMSEEDLLGSLIATARVSGWLVAHFRPARTSRGWRTPIQGDEGFPDLILARAGRVLAIELKRTNVKPTPEQYAWLEAMGCAGTVEVYLWTPMDLDEAYGVLGAPVVSLWDWRQ